MKLNIQLPTKTIQVNGKEIKIPKLGVKHFELIKEPRAYEENMRILMNSIEKNLTKAEQDLVGLHLLAFNSSINTKIEYEGQTYTIDDVKIIQQLKFTYDNKVYRFKSPNAEAQTGTVDQLLKACLMSVKENGIEQGNNIDFLKMPAFVYEWADGITNTVGITIDGKLIKGINNIMEVFNG